jgi:hypothetical protein
MTVSRYGGSDKRRSPRYDRRFMVTIGYEGNTHEIRTINISEHGVLIPKRVPVPIGSHVELTLTIRDETSIFEGVVKRLKKCFINGVETVCVGIDISSSEYQEFVKNNILIA